MFCAAPFVLALFSCYRAANEVAAILGPVFNLRYYSGWHSRLSHGRPGLNSRSRGFSRASETLRLAAAFFSQALVSFAGREDTQHMSARQGSVDVQEQVWSSGYDVKPNALKLSGSILGTCIFTLALGRRPRYAGETLASKEKILEATAAKVLRKGPARI